MPGRGAEEISYLDPLDLAVGEDGNEGFCLGGQQSSLMNHQQGSHGLVGHLPKAGQRGAPVAESGAVVDCCTGRRASPQLRAMPACGCVILPELLSLSGHGPGMGLH